MRDCARRVPDIASLIRATLLWPLRGRTGLGRSRSRLRPLSKSALTRYDVVSCAWRGYEAAGISRCYRWRGYGVAAVARAQHDPVARVGVISAAHESRGIRPALAAFVEELRKLGFAQGRNLLLEYRRVDQDMASVFAGVNELVAWKADVLVACGPELALQAAAAARPALPIVVVANNFDPIARGYVQSLARPGGNVTGIVSRRPELAAKQIELLVEAFPERKRLGALWDALSADQFAAAEREAKARQLEFEPHQTGKSTLRFCLGVSHAGAGRRTDAARRCPAPSLGPRDPQRSPRLATQHRLPSIFILKFYVEAGGLMSYGVDFLPMLRRAASFMQKCCAVPSPPTCR